MTESADLSMGLPAHGEVAGLLETLAREYLVPGVQFAVYDRGEITTFTYGEETHGSGRPVTADTVFPWGSVTKSATALLLAQLVSDGDVELDAPVGPLLPELARTPDGPLYTATLRGLLSHTAGLPDMPPVEDDLSLRDCVAASAGAAALCEPGRLFSYSNLGYVLAGRILESVTGVTWWEAVRDFALSPLGVAAGFLGATAPGPVAGQHAVHLPTGSVHVVDEPGLPKALVPAGALTSSAAGLLRYAEVHLAADGTAVLEPDMLAELRTPVPGSAAFGLADAWGLGLAVHTDGEGRRWLGHDGNTGGASCALRFDPERRIAVALMANATSGRQMGHAFFDALAAKGWDIGRYRRPEIGSPLSGDALTAVADEVCGDYRAGADLHTVRRSGNGELLLERSGLVPVRLEIYQGLEFCLKSGTADGGHGSDESKDLYRFVRDSRTGQVGGMYMSGGRLQVREGIGLIG
ncbi:beta-lactamase family protein [Streptomyces sp. NBC_00190]|uniref:serine hydrolase domain-containing protein n=1 Tax=unclassified Streptomyces TaxID=2593676 RepID=UPI002E2CC82E|nr:serine hydrolase domain-containing protein [Streptomyces sp. NBC_00190]WSZ42919.1 beta-lactamase family protein [Streptomyces sp. NBC_00868]